MPRLRFPEFHEEWREYKLSDIAEIVGGGTPDTGKEEYWNGDIQWFTPTEIKTDYVSKSQRTISNLGLKESSAKLLPKGTILLTTRATIGDTAIALQECATNQGFQSLIVKDNNNIFVYNWLKTIKPELIKKANGSTFLEISKNEVENILIKIPSYAEQTKIANFLSLIDQLCQYQMKIIEGLTSFKSAVSKKIFSQELRFKNEEGKNFPKWEQKTLGDCLDYEQPTNYLVTSTEYQDTFEVPVVTAGKTFILGYTDETTGIFNENLPVIIFDDFTTATQFVTFPFKAKSSAMKILKAKNNINVRFMYESMQMINYEVGGHGRHWISVFAQMEVLIPCFAEQNQIASFLCSLDNKIDLETALLQQLKLQKQYLLQQLFI